MHLKYFLYKGLYKHVLILEKTNEYIFGIVINELKETHAIEVLKQHINFITDNKLLPDNDDNIKVKLQKKCLLKEYIIKINVKLEYYKKFELKKMEI